MASGARIKFGVPMFEPEVFRKQCAVLKKLPETFRRPGNSGPLVTPMPVILHCSVNRPPYGAHDLMAVLQVATMKTIRTRPMKRFKRCGQ